MRGVENIITKGMMSSNTDMWETPQDFFDELNREFKFDTDVCATKENAKCPIYFTSEEDGLRQEWKGVCWMNPPYGRQIGKWVKKAYESALGGATVVCLVPARTDTKWFQDYCLKVLRSNGIRFIKGRLYFIDANSLTGRAPFPSAVVIFSPETIGIETAS